MIEITLPWPPSVNHYWRNFKGRMVLSEHGREYRKSVLKSVLINHDARNTKFGESRIAVHIVANPPDKRRRDIDNLCKGVLDGLAYAGIYQDDSQIDDLRVTRANVEKGGILKITIQELKELPHGTL